MAGVKKVNDTGWKIGFASWRTKRGYSFFPLHPKDWQPQQKLLETVFMLALNQKRRRKDSRLENIEFQGRNIHFYYFGDRMDAPTLILFEGNQKGLRHLLISLAIQRRAVKGEILENTPPLEALKRRIGNWNLQDILRSMKLRIVHTLSNYHRSFIYVTLLRHGEMDWNKLLEICEDLTPVPSALDIREHLLLLSGINLAGFKSARGLVKEKVKPIYRLIPSRKPPKRAWRNLETATLQKVKREAERIMKDRLPKDGKPSVKEEAKNLTFTSSLLLDQKTRAFFSKIGEFSHFNREQIMKLLGKKTLRQLLDRGYLLSEEDGEKIYPLFLPTLTVLPRT